VKFPGPTRRMRAHCISSCAGPIRSIYGARDHIPHGIGAHVFPSIKRSTNRRPIRGCLQQGSAWSVVVARRATDGPPNKLHQIARQGDLGHKISPKTRLVHRRIVQYLQARSDQRSSHRCWVGSARSICDPRVAWQAKCLEGRIPLMRAMRNPQSAL
jgi:hypothetical protein